MENYNTQDKADFSRGTLPEQEKEVSLQDYIRILYRGRWIISVSFIVVMFFTVYFTFTAAPQYEASTLFMLAARPGQTSGLFQNPWMPGNVMKVNNEIEVLKSNALARRVIKSLRNSPYADSLYVLGVREYDKKGIGFSELIAGMKIGIKNLIFGKPEVASGVIDTLDRTLVKGLRGAMKVEPIRDTEAIRLTVTSVDPNEAALLANTIAREYYHLDLEYNLAEVVEMKDFLEEQLEKIEEDLTRSEENLKEYQESEGVFGLDETAQTLIDQLSTFEATYYTTLADLKVTREKLNNQQELLNEREKWIVKEAINTTNPLIVQLRQAIAEMEAEKITAMTVQGLTRDHDAMTEMDTRIKDLKKKLFNEAQNLTSLGLSPEEQSQISLDLLKNVLFSNVEIIALEAKGKEYKQLVDQYSSELNKLPERSLKYARLDRERQVNEKYYVLMKTKYQESRITEASKISNVRIVDPAIPPEKPVKPKKKLNLILGLFIGLGLGVGIAFIKEYLDHSVRTDEDLERAGLSAIAVVPTINVKRAIEKMEKVGKDINGERSLQSRLVSHFDPKSPVAEAYRTLRTNIQFMSPDKPLKTLVVSSAGPKDGKSTTVANLAITFASLGKKTLLLDADLRKPILHKVFDVPRSPGLVHGVIEEIDFSDIIQKTEVPNLHLITCGEVPPNPSELLASQKLKNLLEKMKNEFDIILIDSPPIIAVTDASILSKVADGLLLVVRAGGTDTRALQRAVELLSRVKCNVIGAALNGVNVSAGYGYDSYYYYYHYHYYYGDEGKRKKRVRRKKA
ncbi:MAG: hypothetical protein DRP89_02060 [Candidatus Neomarinimicrobiota bacterium]|nr:MAG: hypothetical protein DRP89_02060 [Candidatus Neomarinimicrobiota bacterium]